MSPMPYASEKRRALTAIFIVFLFIFSEILVAENDVHNQLDDENKVEYSLYQYPSNAETFISLQDPDVNFNSAAVVFPVPGGPANNKWGNCFFSA